jgi:hypothetical protein
MEYLYEKIIDLYFKFTVQHISICDFILIQLPSTFGGVDHV